jgi:hypothetical protein
VIEAAVAFTEAARVRGGAEPLAKARELLAPTGAIRLMEALGLD